MTQKNLLQSAGDGTAVPSGYVGEVITWSTVPTTQTFTTEADWTNAVITVPSGVWRLQAEIQVYSNKGSTVAGDCNTYVKITNSSNTVIENCSARHGVYINSATELIGTALISLSAIVSVSSNTQYKIRAYKAGVSGSASELQNSGDIKSRFYAVRIA